MKSHQLLRNDPINLALVFFIAGLAVGALVYRVLEAIHP